MGLFGGRVRWFRWGVGLVASCLLAVAMPRMADGVELADLPPPPPCEGDGPARPLGWNENRSISGPAIFPDWMTFDIAVNTEFVRGPSELHFYEDANGNGTLDEDDVEIEATFPTMHPGWQCWFIQVVDVNAGEALPPTALPPVWGDADPFVVAPGKDGVLVEADPGVHPGALLHFPVLSWRVTVPVGSPWGGWHVIEVEPGTTADVAGALDGEPGIRAVLGEVSEEAMTRPVAFSEIARQDRDYILDGRSEPDFPIEQLLIAAIDEESLTDVSSELGLDRPKVDFRRHVVIGLRTSRNCIGSEVSRIGARDGHLIVKVSSKGFAICAPEDWTSSSLLVTVERTEIGGLLRSVAAGVTGEAVLIADTHDPTDVPENSKRTTIWLGGTLVMLALGVLLVRRRRHARPS